MIPAINPPDSPSLTSMFSPRLFDTLVGLEGMLGELGGEGLLALIRVGLLVRGVGAATGALATGAKAKGAATGGGATGAAAGAATGAGTGAAVAFVLKQSLGGFSSSTNSKSESAATDQLDILEVGIHC